MLPTFKYPHTSFQQLNLDWIMKTMERLKNAIPLVDNAQTVYESAIAAVESADAAITEATDKANAAAASASAAQTSASNAEYSAGVAQQQATYAATDASAANANAQSAQTAATAAQTAATAAQQHAEDAFQLATSAASAVTWIRRGILTKNTDADVDITTISLSGVRSVLLVSSSTNQLGLNDAVEIPIGYITEESSNGSTPNSSTGVKYQIGTASVGWRLLVKYADNTLTVSFTDINIPSYAIYCRIYTR